MYIVYTVAYNTTLLTLTLVHMWYKDFTPRGGV